MGYGVDGDGSLVVGGSGGAALSESESGGVGRLPVLEGEGWA